MADACWVPVTLIRLSCEKTDRLMAESGLPGPSLPDFEEEEMLHAATHSSDGSTGGLPLAGRTGLPVDTQFCERSALAAGRVDDGRGTGPGLAAVSADQRTTGSIAVAIVTGRCFKCIYPVGRGILWTAHRDVFSRLHEGHARHREYFTYLLWTLGVSCGVVLANDLLLLLVCWGFLGLTLYLMAGISGPDAAEAARKSLMVIGGTDALMLLGIVIYWQLTGNTRMDGPAMAGQPIGLHGIPDPAGGGFCQGRRRAIPHLGAGLR